MVKGDPAAVDTTLLPFMRSNCIYTSDIAMVPYPGYHNMHPDIGRFSLDDESYIGLDIDNSSLMVQSKRFQCQGLVELKFISLLLICCVMKTLVFMMYPRRCCGLMTYCM